MPTRTPAALALWRATLDVELGASNDSQFTISPIPQSITNIPQHPAPKPKSESEALPPPPPIGHGHPCSP